MWIVRLALDRPYTFIVTSILILILGSASIATTPTDICSTSHSVAAGNNSFRAHRNSADSTLTPVESNANATDQHTTLKGS